jgi:hypothetical protein
MSAPGEESRIPPVPSPSGVGALYEATRTTRRPARKPRQTGLRTMDRAYRASESRKK